MGEVEVGNGEHSTGVLLVRALASLLVILTVGLFALSDAEAHQLQPHEFRAPVATIDQLPSTATLKAASTGDPGSVSVGFGIGCSLAGLTVPGQIMPARGRQQGTAFRAATIQTVLDISRAPPSPPPNEDLRFQTD